MSTTHNVKRIIVGALLSGSVAMAGLGLSMGTAQAFDPQPEPPGKVAPSHELYPGEIHGFDPQPEPPGLPAPCPARLNRGSLATRPSGMGRGHSGNVIRWP